MFEYINSRDYKDEEIFTFDFPDGKNLQYLYGKCKGKNNNDEMMYSCGVLGGSAIILKYNSKLIAFHKGTHDQYSKISSAIPIKSIIEKINIIKCVYNIDEKNVGKEINIKSYYNIPHFFDNGKSGVRRRPSYGGQRPMLFLCANCREYARSFLSAQL